MGRPKKPVDPKMVQDLAAIGCKNNEIATLLDVSANTIERRFAPQLRKGRENLKMSLRRWQLEAAKKGNVAMLIWLGKQYLSQTEKVEEKITQEVKQEIIYATEWASKLPDETNS
ncbi:hypothetical protein EBZ39_05245 [bacterium]|nr:hypothetical protein [bacterium]